MQSPAVRAHETGKVGPEEFAVGVVADLNLPTTPDSFLRAFGDGLIGPLPAPPNFSPRYRMAVF